MSFKFVIIDFAKETPTLTEVQDSHSHGLLTVFTNSKLLTRPVYHDLCALDSTFKKQRF